jgi:CBS domain-containing protein
MKVSEIMTTEVACCRPTDSNSRAAQLLWEHDCGVLPVVDEDRRIVGMVSDRDLCMAAYTRGRKLADIEVQDVMSWDVCGCAEQDSLPQALDLMRRGQVRRLPVLDAQRRVVGILSVNDVVRVLCTIGEWRKRKPLVEALIASLESIGEHRDPPALACPETAEDSREVCAVAS